MIRMANINMTKTMIDSNLGDIFKDDNDKYGDQNDVKRKSWAICNNFSKPSTRQPL